MTDIPKAGFLCAGKNPLELSVSVHCARKLMDSLKKSGFSVGSCYTEICENIPVKARHAEKTLSYLCLTNDLVITVGCDGFSSADIIPDVTDVVCAKKAVYFSNVLCGSVKVSKMGESVNFLSDDDSEDALEVWEIPPSRACAGICGDALVLNFSNDVYSAVMLINALMSAIGFTVYNISGKSAASAIKFEKSLKNSPECKDFFKKCSAVNI